MQFFGAVIIFLIAFMAAIVLIVLFYIRKGFIRLRQHLTGDYDDETVKRMSDKYYRGEGSGPQFDKNYFKGSGKGFHHHHPHGGQQQAQQQTRQTTTTQEGVTIIDDRPKENRRKIFKENEGEYVDFVEE
jgi:hypothetical protein